MTEIGSDAQLPADALARIERVLRVAERLQAIEQANVEAETEGEEG